MHTAKSQVVRKGFLEEVDFQPEIRITRTIRRKRRRRGGGRESSTHKGARGMWEAIPALERWHNGEGTCCTRA